MTAAARRFAPGAKPVVLRYAQKRLLKAADIFENQLTTSFSELAID